MSQAAWLQQRRAHQLGKGVREAAKQVKEGALQAADATSSLGAFGLRSWCWGKVQAGLLTLLPAAWRHQLKRCME